MSRSTSRSAGRSNTSLTHSRVASRSIGKRRVAGGDGEEVGGLLALLPQRRAAVGPAARQQQGPGGGLAEAAGEQRRPRQRRHDELVDLVGVDGELLERAARRRPRAGAARCRRRSTAARPRGPSAPTAGPAAPSPTARAPARRTATARSTRQSPISSRKRSTTMVRSSGTTPVASACSSRYCRRLRAARSSRPCRSRRRSRAADAGEWRTSRTNWPTARPSSRGRPGPSPCQNGILPGCPGAGVTTTRSKVMSSMRHVDAPSRNVSPGRDSYTISSSSSPTRVPSGRNTPNSPRSGIVPAFVTARRCDPERPRTTPLTRSHTTRGRSSPNSSDG